MALFTPPIEAEEEAPIREEEETPIGEEEEPPIGRLAFLCLELAMEHLPTPQKAHFLSSCWMVAFTRKGSSKSVVSPQPLPVTGSSRAESGLCHFTARVAMSPMISASCSALVSPGRGIVSRPVPQTAE